MRVLASSGLTWSTFGWTGGWKPRWWHVHCCSLTRSSFWCRLADTVLNAAIFTRYFSTDLIDKTDYLFLIVAVHHLQPPARLLLLHVPQGTLQAEDNIFILLYNLHERGGGEEVQLNSKLYLCSPHSIQLWPELLHLDFTARLWKEV